jgi:hypothetical protein
LQKFMVTCDASGAREHGHDSKHEASSGTTNNARKGVDESVWVCNSWSTRARRSWRINDRVGRKPMQGGARGTPGRSAQAGRPPLQKEPPGSRLRQASIPFLAQFVCSSFHAQNHRRHSQPSQA